MPAILNPDGTLVGSPVDSAGMLRLVSWAYPEDITVAEESGNSILLLRAGRPLDTPMQHSPATGRALVTNGTLGVDLIRLESGDGFQPHTHPGDHLLICVAGEGTITYDGHIYGTRAGQVSMIDGEVPHAVGAITNHMILAVGSPHRGVGDPDRMKLSAYAEVLVSSEMLNCLICEESATLPEYLHDKGCAHCPCAACNPIPEERQ